MRSMLRLMDPSRDGKFSRRLCLWRVAVGWRLVSEVEGGVLSDCNEKLKLC